MPERLPRELRVVYEFARIVAAGSDDVDDVLERICREVGASFGFERTRIVREEGGGLLDRAREEGRAVAAGGSAVVPLLVAGRSFGFLVGDRRRDPLDETDLHLLTTLGIVAAAFVDRASQATEQKAALEQLRRLDSHKSEFISIASHELRTPVAVVHGVAATLHLRGDELREGQVAQLHRALFEQSSRMRELIEQLLDLSRVEAGAIVVRPERFRPRAWIDGLLPRIAPDRFSDVVVEIDPALELETDPDAFERVVGNLVANALRYGRPPVFVRCKAGATVCVTVEDRGDGVPPEFVPDLFGRFTRSEAHRLADRLGAGLGLSIARSFAEALGGTLSYETAEPHGARFILELPEALPLARRDTAAHRLLSDPE